MSEQKIYEKLIRTFPDYPKKGINFIDWMPVLGSPEALQVLTEDLANLVKGRHFTKLAALETRGYLIGLPLAKLLGLGFVPIRKKGKLPFKEGDLVAVDIVKEYGKDQVFYRVSDLTAGKPVDGVIPITFFDDILATGGTARGIVESLNAQKVTIDGKEYPVKVTDFVFLVEIDDLPGRKVIEGLAPVKSLIHVTEG